MTTSVVNNLKESKAEVASNTEAATITNTPAVPVPTDKTNDQEEAGMEAAQGWDNQKQQRCQIQSYSETTTMDGLSKQSILHHYYFSYVSIIEMGFWVLEN